MVGLTRKESAPPVLNAFHLASLDRVRRPPPSPHSDITQRPHALARTSSVDSTCKLHSTETSDLDRGRNDLGRKRASS